MSFLIGYSLFLGRPLELAATAAMNLDGGESTEMVLQGASGQRIVNVLTSENNEAYDGYVPSGVVENYLKIDV